MVGPIASPLSGSRASRTGRSKLNLRVDEEAIATSRTGVGRANVLPEPLPVSLYATTGALASVRNPSGTGRRRASASSGPYAIVRPIEALHVAP